MAAQQQILQSWWLTCVAISRASFCLAFSSLQGLWVVGMKP